MKPQIQSGLIALLLATAPLGALAQTTFFTDTFGNGSTTNGPSVPGGSPNVSFTSYDMASTKNSTNSKIVAGDFTLKLNAGTTAGWVETQALFTTHPVVLSAMGDYIEISVVFTNTPTTNAASTNLPVTSLLAGGTSSTISIGLFDSGGGTQPVPGGLANAGLTTTAGSPFATGNAELWQGYAAQIASNGTSRFYTRPIQNGTGTTSANQDLVELGAGSGAFVNPAGTVIATTPAAPVPLVAGGKYTLYFKITLTDVNTLSLSNSLFAGAGTGGALIFTQTNAVATNGNFLTGNFDGFSIGIFNKSTAPTPAIQPAMDITSIVIDGQSTPVNTAPIITAQPQPAIIADGGSGQYTVAATGFGLQYQWHRNGTNLLNGGNISGVSGSQLIISPASASDAATGTNGYYVTVSGTGGFSTNSGYASLTIVAPTNLIWTASSGSVWDLTNTASWQDTNGNQAVFTYGDAVRFDDTASSKFLSLVGNYLSASSVTVDSEAGNTYTFNGSGSFAGPGSLLYTGTGQLTLNNANTYSGGTLLSNTTTPGALYLFLENYNGLGTGPVVLDNHNGTMEIMPTGSATLGINGTIDVLDDFFIKVDGAGTFATVFLGDLAGTAGKTLTIDPATTGQTNRFRVYGTNTVFNANLILDNTNSVNPLALYNGTTLAPYLPSGTQTYNGVISGVGGIVQRGNGSTILAGLNTYSGGTYTTAGAIGLGIDSNPTSGTVTSGPLGVGPLYISPEVNTAAGGGGTGTVFSSGGAHTIANPLQYPSGTNNQTLIIGGTNSLTFTGPYTLNGVDNAGSPTNRTLQVTNTGLTTLTGVISDNGAGFGFTKTGSGILALNNTETYTGSTSNTAGTLWVNGSLAAASAVTVSTNATLGGTGTINGAVTINVGGTLAPGTAAIGTLTINNNVTLAGNALFKVSNASGLVSDRATVSGTLNNTGTGTLTVSNLGPALVVGNKFTLFSKPLANGNALTVTGGGATWKNDLAVDGSISVQPSVATNSTNITFTYTATTITLNWPSNHLGWRLQSQTNPVGVGVTTNWATVAGSTNVTQVVQPIAPSGSAFYRMVYP